MTLLQISVSKDRALIATDTTCYASDQGEHRGADVYRWDDGEPVHVTKLHSMPHIRAVLTGRGMSTVRQFAAEQITHARDFEHAVEILNRRLPALPVLPGTYKGEPLRHTVQLVGWSDLHGCMCLATWESGNDYRSKVQHGTPRGWFQSLGPSTKRPAWISDSEQVAARQAELYAYLEAERERDARCIDTAAAYARLAVEHAREEDPAAPYGGRLLVAELTRDGLQIVDCGDLGLPPRRAGADDVITARPGLATACIQPGATTDTFYDQDAGPVDVVYGADVLARTVGPYTAETTLVVTFTGQVTYAGTFSGGPSAVSGFVRIDDDEDGTGALIGINPTGGVQALAGFSVSKRIILPAATSCEVRGFAQVGASGPVLTLTGDVENAALLIEVLKN